jgi:hypothetical protein
MLYCQEFRLKDEEFYWKNSYSTGNFQLRNVDFPGGMGFRRKLSAHRQGIHLRNGIPPDIVSS